MSSPSILILTGQSGSGKSTALHALEDEGYLCVDNVPASVAESLIVSLRNAEALDRLALVIDVRDPDRLRHAPAVVGRLRNGMEPFQLVYFEAREEDLLRRYSETRRRHPLDNGIGLHRAIVAERELLADLRELADDTVDTSSLSPHDLRADVIRQLAGATPGDDLRMALLSFGFKHGVPLDADMVLDVRFLSNPYFVPELRDATGLDEVVRRYVLDTAEARSYVDETFNYLSYLLPRFQREGKRYLTVCIGCTGGQHRSVSIAHALAERFREHDVTIDLQHRDIGEGRR